MEPPGFQAFKLQACGIVIVIALDACGGRIKTPPEDPEDAALDAFVTADAAVAAMPEAGACGTGVYSVGGGANGCFKDWDYGCPAYHIYCDCKACMCSHDGHTFEVGVPSVCFKSCLGGGCDGDGCPFRLMAQVCGFPTQ